MEKITTYIYKYKELSTDVRRAIFEKWMLYKKHIPKYKNLTEDELYDIFMDRDEIDMPQYYHCGCIAAVYDGYIEEEKELGKYR